MRALSLILSIANILLSSITVIYILTNWKTLVKPEAGV